MSESRNCDACGNPNLLTSKFCVYCGKPMSQIDESSIDSSEEVDVAVSESHSYVAHAGTGNSDDSKPNRSDSKFWKGMRARINRERFESIFVANWLEILGTIALTIGVFFLGQLFIEKEIEIAKDQLRQEGKLKIKDFEDKVTFHDPCYLGRIGGETEAPREVLGGDLVEMERHGTKSFCCGGGGARVWMEEDADKRVNEIRAKEASKTGADCVAVGCPYCMTMMSDGLKSIGDEKQVKDISEILLENLEAET